MLCEWSDCIEKHSLARNKNNVHCRLKNVETQANGRRFFCRLFMEQNSVVCFFFFSCLDFKLTKKTNVMDWCDEKEWCGSCWKLRFSCCRNSLPSHSMLWYFSVSFWWLLKEISLAEVIRKIRLFILSHALGVRMVTKSSS